MQMCWRERAQSAACFLFILFFLLSLNHSNILQPFLVALGLCFINPTVNWEDQRPLEETHIFRYNKQLNLICPFSKIYNCSIKMVTFEKCSSILHFELRSFGRFCPSKITQTHKLNCGNMECGTYQNFEMLFLAFYCSDVTVFTDYSNCLRQLNVIMT